MAMTAGTIRRHLDYLCNLGPRPIGSAANDAAAGYLKRELEALDFAAEEQRYPCTAWECQEALLEVNGAREPLTVNAYSLPCDVRARVIPVGTVAELEGAELAGGIALFHGDLARVPISPPSWFLKGERDDRIFELLRASRAAAVLCVDYGTSELGQVLEAEDFEVASATVSWATGLRLLRAPGNIRLKIEARQSPASTANIVGRRPGRRPEMIVLCAHYDTKINTPGACDNGGGVATILALAEDLRARRPGYGLEIVCFTGEEYLPIGDDEYIRRAGGESGHGFSRVSAAINLDGAGAALGSNSITAIACSKEYEDWVRQKAATRAGVVWVEPWPQSNHSTFSWRGVPSLALSSVGGLRIAHRPEDVVECMSVEKLVEAGEMVVEIVDGIQERSPQWLGRKAKEGA